MKVLPIFLNDLSARRCIIIGGNHEAERKAEELLGCEAPVTVISPHVTPQLAAWADAGRITWLARPYQPGDLAGAFLVIASEINPELSSRIWQEAQAEKVLMNAMDDVPHCSFVSGSVVKQGRLTVAISTAGAAPTLSVRLRQEFEQKFGPEYAELLELLAALREPMRLRYPDFKERRPLWYSLIDSDLLPLLKQKEYEAALERIAALLGPAIAAHARASLTPNTAGNA